MEKRFIIAVMLSFLVLYFWSATLPKSYQKNKLNSKNLSTEEVKNFNISKNESIEYEVEKMSQVSEKTERINTEKLKVEFSNVGGKIKNVQINDYKAYLPINNILSIKEYENKEFKLQEITENSIIYVYENEDIEIINKFNVSKNDYIVQSECYYKNKLNYNKIINLNFNILNLDMSNLENVQGAFASNNEKSLYEYVIKTENEFIRKNSAYKFSQKEIKSEKSSVNWVGFRNRYFCALIKPEFKVTDYSINVKNEKNLNISINTEKINLEPNEAFSFKYFSFFGPEKVELLKNYKHTFEEVKNYYNFSLFDAVAKLIYKIVHLNYKIIPNWGLSIIILSIFIYFLTYPLTLKSMASVKKMQALQPKIAVLKEKHKNNPQKLQIEQMELFKKNKINPASGCLPMLLQMPVFLGLYQALWRDVSFKGAKFLWIKDLSEPDRLFVFNFQLPIVGNELNLLPIIMIVLMYFQQKNTSVNMATVDAAQAQQQKIMTFVMPIFLGVIFYKFASGLSLYFTMFYAFSAITQWKTSKISVETRDT